MLLFVNLTVKAQENYPNCLNPSEIDFPVSINVGNKMPNELYYQPEDEYTYWYKLRISTDSRLYFEISSINNKDDYDMIIYKYKGNDLCNDIVSKKAVPLLNKTKGELNVKKGEVYYLSILHLSGISCGHLLTLRNDNKEIKIKAIHNDCVEEVLAAIIDQDTLVEVYNDSIVETPLQLNDTHVKTNQLKGVVVNKHTQKQIEAELSTSNLSGTLLSKTKSNIDDGFIITNVSEERVLISINHFGYESFTDTVEVNNSQIKIELNPIKVGEKIIMHKIYFHPNTFALKEESTKELLKLNKFMLENSQYSFEIQGHTNGNKAVKTSREYEGLGEEWNFTGSAKKLSKLRAEKIKDYLVKNGVKETQIQTVGYGGDKMIVDKPKNMKQAMQNIRVEIIVLK